MLLSIALLAHAAGGCATTLWIIAIVLGIAGIITLIRGSVIAGIVLIVLAFLVGPGGYSIFSCGGGVK
jgi:hypothetical protein